MVARAQRQAAAMHTRDGAAQRQADAGAAVLRRRSSRAERPRRCARAVPAARPARGRAPRTAARRRHAAPAARPAHRARCTCSALSSRLTSICTISTASQRSSGRPGSTRERTRRCGSWRRTRASAVPTSSSADSQSSASARPGASRRASCRVFSVRRARRSASSTIDAARRCRCSRDSRASCSTSDDAAPRIVASGVRWSCAIAASSALRTCCACACSRAAPRRARPARVRAPGPSGRTAPGHGHATRRRCASSRRRQLRGAVAQRRARAAADTSAADLRGGRCRARARRPGACTATGPR